MRRLLTTLMCTLVGGAVFGQWTQTSFKKVDSNKKGTTLTSQLSGVRDNGYYKLDLNLLRSQLKNAQEMGANSKPVVISIPTIDGKIEKFNVYSFPVVVKSLAEQYQLGSYIGAGIDDPTKTVRFSLSPKGFNSMVIKDGVYEFIDPQASDRSIYGVHLKTVNTGNKSFVCSTIESPSAVKDIERLLKNGKSFTNQPNVYSKSSDKKYRTMRLVISVTGEYTQYHGGTIAGALSAINATMSRVNGVFEKDFALHLNVQDFQNVIYTNAATDPYSDAVNMDNWNVELQQTLTANVQNTNYDIGHLFGASGGGGNAGCIGCVCINPASATDTAKGSGYTSPGDGIPEGDNFDIDYVAHEMGHQLGANHTFSHKLEGSGVNMEPGSGSTIMGYAGITGANNDVQPHSNAYFHIASIDQVQENLGLKTCDVEIPIVNNPPVISDLPTYNIPKGTAFVLTASATDPENDPITYAWEEVDNAKVTINKNNLGNTTSGASFRSMVPSTNPTRYFPRFTSVMNGVLNNANNNWEAVSTRPRTTNFAVTVRDNNPNIYEQQSNYKIQTVIVGDNGPFRLANQYVNVNTPSPIQWIVANTNVAPYNVTNVKIDYTTDEGATWNVLAASTPNDGSEDFTFPSSLNGQVIKVRISSIGNIFYAVGSVTVAPIAPCSSAAPTNIVVSNISNFSASVSWMSYTGATYKVRYKKVAASVWTEIDTNVPSVNLNNLSDGTPYEVQVALVCGTSVGTYSASTNFTTPAVSYCAAYTIDASYEYISNVTLANVNNSSGGTPYSNFTTSTGLQINLTKGTTYPISVSIANPDYDAVAAYIDFNKDGMFDDSEVVLNYPVGIPSAPITGSVVIPSNAVEGTPLRMRVVVFYAGSTNAGLYLPSDYMCGLNFQYGEVEDYNVVISPAVLATNENTKKDNFGIYPNPVTDVLNVTKVSNKATYEIHNTVGQIVKKGVIENNKVNVAELLRGNYIISIKDNNISENFKFIKK
ncbi:reprolysin-like metallopeptidase [Chryseobacterium oryctis]|uniref:M12 family metallo-peptidase n=1 Tax=Chryseobacterium oryctis TaxID=2952618 RepID=A0ABT3HKC7_9FLAO|nr:zinc-dependent metalloprotease family protein [Chryseobacterium oryctis]MCW3160245.1 M12 family metallo-peptidase [Chryseobacterium oryctis]